MSIITRLRHAVVLDSVDQENGYLAFYSRPRDAIFVAVVTESPVAFESGVPCIAEILTTEEFEIKGGVLSVAIQRRAAAVALDPVAFRAWQRRHLGIDYMPPLPRVITIYATEGGSIAKRFFKNAPVCQAWIEERGLENAFGHPGFATWYAAQLERAGIPHDALKKIVITDMRMMTLRLNAQDHDCPGCTIRWVALAEETDAEEAPQIKSRGWFRRFIDSVTTSA
ncbi:hypothetical protein [Paraburkholderia sp. C35]|uniref:hypothetical protein n=1 Tax=Paraburkholderia sp. C35 TaxID=2126993 RepID=UPI0013A5A075|nr:hypothetical protein [Paraburkholderia sp. C35]